MRPRWLFHAITAVVLLIGLAAVVLGYYLYRGATFPRVPMRLAGTWLLEPDGEVGLVATPNAATEFHMLDSGLRYHVYTDRVGARVDRPGDQTPAPVDLLTVGCSFTWGYGVENEDTYSAQLGRLLGATVANFGMGSYGSIQSLQMLRRHADLRPKVVVYGFIPDHLWRNVSPCAPSAAPYCVPTSYFARNGSGGDIHPPRFELFAIDELRRFHEEVLMRDRQSLADQLLAAKWALRLDLSHYAASKDVAYDDTLPNAAAAIRFAIAEMAKTARAAGAQLVVLHIPYLQPGQQTPPPAPLVQAVEEANAFLVDLTPAVVQHLQQRPRGRLVFDKDPHPNPVAHRLIAEQLAARLR